MTRCKSVMLSSMTTGILISSFSFIPQKAEAGVRDCLRKVASILKFDRGPRFNALIPEFQVADLEKSRDFYIHILGFKLAFEREEFLFLELGKAQLMVTTDAYVTAPLEAPLGRGMNLEIEVKNLEPLLKNLRARNYPLFREPHDCTYECGPHIVTARQFLVQDPDGYLLRFSSALGDK